MNFKELDKLIDQMVVARSEDLFNDKGQKVGVKHYVTFHYIGVDGKTIPTLLSEQETLHVCELAADHIRSTLKVNLTLFLSKGPPVGSINQPHQSDKGSWA